MIHFICNTEECKLKGWIAFYAKDPPENPTCQSCDMPYDIHATDESWTF